MGIFSIFCRQISEFSISYAIETAIDTVQFESETHLTQGKDVIKYETRDEFFER